jgi:hypothetical protein
VEEGIFLLDTRDDNYSGNYRWPSSPTPPTPLTIFPLQLPREVALAVGGDTIGTTFIRQLDLLHSSDGSLIQTFHLNDSADPFFLGSDITAMTTNPFHPNDVFASNALSGSDSYVVADVPVPLSKDSPPAKPVVYLQNAPLNNLVASLSTVRNSNGGGRRTVFFFHNAVGPTNDTIFYLNDTGGGPRQKGPLSCSDDSLCKQPFRITAAVPDPTSSTAVFAACDKTNTVRNVVRIDGAACQLVLDGNSLRNLTYPDVLAIGEAL